MTSVNVHQIQVFKMYIPPEVLEIIFDKVKTLNTFTSGGELLNCSRTCVQFYNILTPTKCVWLFKEIIPILYSELDKQTLLVIRQVCQDWKQSLDHFLDNYGIYLKKCNNQVSVQRKLLQNFPCSPPHPLGELQFFTRFHSVQKLQRYVDYVEEKDHLCVFPGGSLSLKLHDTNVDRGKFLGLLTELLSKHGEKVHYLLFSDSTYSPQEFRSYFNRHLSFVSNLKELHLSFRFHFLNAAPWTVALERLLQFKLRHLRVIEFKTPFEMARNNKVFLELVFLPLSPMFHHLRSLRINGSVFNESLANNVYSTEFLTNLQNLELHVSSQKQLEFVNPMLESTKKLSTLSIVAGGDPSAWGKETVILKKVLSALQPLGDNLVSLKICCLVGNPKVDIHRYANVCVELFNKDESDVTTRCFRTNFRIFSHFTRLRELHLHGFSFIDQSILPYLPKSLEYLLLECCTSDGGHSFPNDLHDGQDVYFNYKLWECLPVLKFVGQRKLPDIYQEDSELESWKVYWRDTANWKQEELMLKMRDKAQTCWCV